MVSADLIQEQHKITPKARASIVGKYYKRDSLFHNEVNKTEWSKLKSSKSGNYRFVLVMSGFVLKNQEVVIIVITNNLENIFDSMTVFWESMV